MRIWIGTSLWLWLYVYEYIYAYAPALRGEYPTFIRDYCRHHKEQYWNHVLFQACVEHFSRCSDSAKHWLHGFSYVQRPPSPSTRQISLGDAGIKKVTEAVCHVDSAKATAWKKEDETKVTWHWPSRKRRRTDTWCSLYLLLTFNKALERRSFSTFKRWLLWGLVTCQSVFFSMNSANRVVHCHWSMVTTLDHSKSQSHFCQYSCMKRGPVRTLRWLSSCTLPDERTWCLMLQ